MDVDKDLDVKGKLCPFPLITLAKEVRGLEGGKLLRITGDDPIFEEAVLDFCREGGHEILESNRDGREVTIIFKV